MIISASALRRCGWARVLSARRPRGANVEAAGARGAAFHAAVEYWARFGVFPEDIDDELLGWLQELARQWTPPADARFEWALGLGEGPTYVPVRETEPHVYVMDDVAVPEGFQLLTAGRADAVWIQDGVAFVLDYKTGRWAPEHPSTNLQLWALGLAAALALGARAVRVGLYYVRDGVFEWSDEVEVDGEEWRERYLDVGAAALVGDAPRPGPGCASCWERRNCEHAEVAA